MLPAHGFKNRPDIAFDDKKEVEEDSVEAMHDDKDDGLTLLTSSILSTATTHRRNKFNRNDWILQQINPMFCRWTTFVMMIILLGSLAWIALDRDAGINLQQDNSIQVKIKTTTTSSSNTAAASVFPCPTAINNTSTIGDDNYDYSQLVWSCLTRLQEQRQQNQKQFTSTSITGGREETKDASSPSSDSHEEAIYGMSLEQADRLADWLADNMPEAWKYGQVVKLFSLPLLEDLQEQALMLSAKSSVSNKNNNDDINSSSRSSESTTANQTFTMLANGGSPTGGGRVGIEGTYQNALQRRLQQRIDSAAASVSPSSSSIRLLHRGHGHRNTFHSFELMHSFVPSSNVDVIFWEFSLNDNSAVADYNRSTDNQDRPDRELVNSGKRMIHQYLQQLARLYHPNPPPKVIFVGFPMERLGFIYNFHLTVVEEVCQMPEHRHRTCLGMIHVPNFFKGLQQHEQQQQVRSSTSSLLWSNYQLRHHFMGDPVHPNRIIHALVGRLVYDLLTTSSLQNATAATMPSPDSKKMESLSKIPPPSQRQVPLQLQQVIWSDDHFPIASFTGEFPINDDLSTKKDLNQPGGDDNKMSPTNNTTSTTTTPHPDIVGMIHPSNSDRVDQQQFGRALPTRVDRKFQIVLHPCHDQDDDPASTMTATGTLFENPTFQFDQEEFPWWNQHKYHTTPIVAIGIAGVILRNDPKQKLSAAECQHYFEELLQVQVVVSNSGSSTTTTMVFTNRNDSSFSWSPSPSLTSEISYSHMDLASIYIVFDPPLLELQQIHCCRRSTSTQPQDETLEISLAQLVLYR